MTSPPIGSRPEGSGLSMSDVGLPGSVTSDQCGSRDEPTAQRLPPLAMDDVELLWIAKAALSPVKDRPTSSPGGCECENCGTIFIGSPDDCICGVCDAGQDFRWYFDPPAVIALIEDRAALREEVERSEAHRNDLADTIVALRTRLVASEARAREAVEALKPFAALADAFEDESWAEDDALEISCQDWVVDNTKLSIFHLRAAARALTSADGPKGHTEVGPGCTPNQNGALS